MWEAKTTGKEDWPMSGNICAQENANSSRATRPLQGLDDLHGSLARDSCDVVVDKNWSFTGELPTRREHVHKHSGFGEVYMGQGFWTRGPSEDSEESTLYERNSQASQEEIALVASVKVIASMGI
ncbi:hypothetical protein GOP47_0026444, partial [Adiantum capillus-veneris]